MIAVLLPAGQCPGGVAGQRGLVTRAGRRQPGQYHARAASQDEDAAGYLVRPDRHFR